MRRVSSNLRPVRSDLCERRGDGERNRQQKEPVDGDAGENRRERTDDDATRPERRDDLHSHRSSSHGSKPRASADNGEISGPSRGEASADNGDKSGPNRSEVEISASESDKEEPTKTPHVAHKRVRQHSLNEHDIPKRPNLKMGELEFIGGFYQIKQVFLQNISLQYKLIDCFQHIKNLNIHIIISHTCKSIYIVSFNKLLLLKYYLHILQIYVGVKS